jgi:transcriptional regulator with XRE-family HTH domain
MDVIAKRLKEFREEKGYNQEGMAKIAGMSQRAWDGWEEMPPNALRSLVALARHFGVSTDYLLKLTDNPRSVENKPLPEGGSEVLNYLDVMSDRARQEVIALVRALYELDQRWQRYERAITMIQQLGGENMLDQLERSLGSELFSLQEIRLIRLEGVILNLDPLSGTLRIKPPE